MTTAPLGIDRKKAHRVGKGGGLAEAQGEVELLAEQQHEVGPGETAVGAAQPGIVDPARTLARQRGNSGDRLQFQHPAPASAPRHGGTGQDQGAVRGLEAIEDILGIAVAQLRTDAGRHLRLRGMIRNLCLQQVDRKAEVDRTGAAAGRDPQGPGDDLPKRLGAGRGVRPLGHRGRHRGLVELLEGPHAGLRNRAVAAYQHQGGLGRPGDEQARDAVAMPGPGGEQGDPRFAAEPAPSVGHVYRGCLVAGVDEPDVAADAGVEERQVLVAGEREEMADSGRGQRLNDALCPIHPAPIACNRGAGRAGSARLSHLDFKGFPVRLERPRVDLCRVEP